MIGSEDATQILDPIDTSADSIEQNGFYFDVASESIKERGRQVLRNTEF
jgi:hypothetical protein